MSVGSINTLGPIIQLNQVQRDTAKTLNQLATGQRINSAADDPAGLGISERMKAQINQNEAQVRNLSMGSNFNETAEGALSGINEALGHIQELTVQAQDVMLTSSDRMAIQEEIDQLSTSIRDTVLSTKFNDLKVLPAALPDLLKLSQINVLSDPNQASQTALEAIDTVSSLRAGLGSSINAAEHTINALNNATINTVAAESQISDLDIAKAVSDLAAQNTRRHLAIGAFKLATKANEETTGSLLSTIV
ncbi:MAG: flagellin [Deltaproteobacteria bacterium]|nr:flagellin [Deltaproteobacteria bacterium]